MPKTGERRDHELVALFHVEIEGIDGAAFNKCSGLKTETEVFELQEGGENSLVRKLIGQSRASNIVLTSGFVNAADRKSTRLNSSHVEISYAVFCLKKKR